MAKFKSKINLENRELEEVLNSQSIKELKIISEYIDQRINELYFEDDLIRRGLKKGTLEILNDNILGDTYLSSRLINILHSAGIRTLLQVRNLGAEGLAKIDGIGKTGMQELKEEFERRGHTL